MIPTAYRTRQRRTRRSLVVAKPGRGERYLVRENSPYSLASGIEGGLEWFELVGPLISGLISAGGQVVGAKINADAITKQVAMQTQATKDIAVFNAQKALELQTLQSGVTTTTAADGTVTQTIGNFTSSPYFLPIAGGVLMLLLWKMKG